MARQPAPLEELDCRVQREREKERHGDPGQDLAGHPDDGQDSRYGQDNPDHGQDRARPKDDDPLFGHGVRIAAGSDGRVAG